MTTTIFDQTWYFRLNPSSEGRSLLKENPLERLRGKVIVSMETPDEKRIYTHFPSFIELGRFLHKVPVEMQHFHEIIPGDFFQKAHFDLDIKYADFPRSDAALGEMVLESLIRAILSVLDERGTKLSLERDLLVYSSSNHEKYSSHVLIANYYHLNHQEAKSFFHSCLSRMPPEYGPFLDSGVYNSKQSFRLLGSRKINSDRPKRFLRQWTFGDRTIDHRYKVEPEDGEHEMMLQLESSLISCIVSCRPLPDFGDVSPKSIIKDSIEVSEPEAREAIITFLRFTKVPTDKFPYRLRGISGPFISLERVAASVCLICQRVHESENPYLRMTPDRHLFFYCRRALPGSRLYIGSLGAIPEPKIPKQEQTPGLTPIPTVVRLPEKTETPKAVNVVDLTKRMAQMPLSSMKPVTSRKKQIDPGVLNSVLDDIV